MKSHLPPPERRCRLHPTSAGSALAAPSHLMTYAQVMFIKSDAAQRGIGGISPAPAEEFQEATITAPLEQSRTTDPATATTFLSRPEIACTGGVWTASSRSHFGFQ